MFELINLLAKAHPFILAIISDIPNIIVPYKPIKIGVWCYQINSFSLVNVLPLYT